MKRMKQFGWIAAVSCIGEILKYFLPFPIPGSIYGLILMMLCLMTGLIQLEQVKETGEFLIEIMPLMFIPAGVGLIASWREMDAFLLPFCFITIVSTLLVMAITGCTAEQLLRYGEKGERKHE